MIKAKPKEIKLRKHEQRVLDNKAAAEKGFARIDDGDDLPSQEPPRFSGHTCTCGSKRVIVENDEVLLRDFRTGKPEKTIYTRAHCFDCWRVWTVSV